MEDRHEPPDKPRGAAAANERAKPIAPGYLGLNEMTQAVNWQLALDLGRGVARVMVAPRSPAKKAGIASGDYVVSINGTTFEAFSAKPPPVGAVALVKVFREGKGFLLFDATLAEEPLPKAARRIPPIKSVPCGAPVTRGERLKWLSRITGDPRLSPRDKAVAARLALYYLNRCGEAYPA